MIWAALYIASIFLANWMIVTFGLVPVGFGLLAPAGVYAAGLAFTARDLLQDALGKRWVAGAVLVGAALSALVSPQFALASGGAFLVSEFADFVVYTPLRRRDWVAAVAVSNAVGLVIDSALFLLLAFGSLDLLAGQVVGKAWMTALAIVALGAARRWRRAAA
jgi:uncharacterized PurR-regulated membrane protein YhhQ (DUF165 family)